MLLASKMENITRLLTHFCFSVDIFVLPHVAIAFEDFLFQVQPAAGACLSHSASTEQFFSPQRYFRLVSEYIYI